MPPNATSIARRKVIVAARELGISQAEIARFLGVTEMTVLNHLGRAQADEPPPDLDEHTLADIYNRDHGTDFPSSTGIGEIRMFAEAAERRAKTMKQQAELGELVSKDKVATLLVEYSQLLTDRLAGEEILHRLAMRPEAAAQVLPEVVEAVISELNNLYDGL